jgi:hypothetical protein
VLTPLLHKLRAAAAAAAAAGTAAAVPAACPHLQQLRC